MVRVVVSAAVLGLMGLFCRDARSQQPDRAVTAVAPAAAPAAPSASPALPMLEPAVTPECPAGDATFDAEVSRYARLKAFTAELAAARERKARDAVAQRLEQAVAFERTLREAQEREAELAAAREVEEEREFEASVEAYVRKQAFTRALVERRKNAAPRK